MDARNRLIDTSPDAEALLTALYRRMTPQEKLERVRSLTIAVNQLAMAGLRMRHPDAPESELRLRLARIRLGPTLADSAYPESLTLRDP